MKPFSPNDFAELVMVERKASVERNTLETQVKCSINLDGSGKARFDIGVLSLNTCWTRLPAMG